MSLLFRSRLLVGFGVPGLLFVAPALANAGPPPKAHHPHAAAAASPAHHHLQPTSAHHGATAKFAEPPKRHDPGRSVGSPTEGHLIGGAHLLEAPHLRIVPVYQAGDARWGLEPLVNMLDHAARIVRKQFPDAVMSVGHLSRHGGGEIDRHASHESGRDADVGFYVRNQQGKPIYADHFVAFKGDGTAPSWPGAQFDDPRNWAFVASVAGDPQARVTHIFVAMPLRTRLLQYAEKVGAPPAIRSRAAELMAQPKGSLPHDDHFHVRIACPHGMDKCIEQPQARKHHHFDHHGQPHNSQSVAQVKKAPPGHGGAQQHHAPAPPPSQQAHANAKAAAPPNAPHAAQPPPAPPAPHAKNEDLVPSLAPEIPGLDSAIIPAPLAGVKQAPPTAQDPKPTPPPEAQPIDDPDGVLEKK